MMIVDEGLELLTEKQCLQLLAIGEVGRVALSMGAMPVIFPVNYRLIEGTILFRTSPGSKLSAATQGSVVAFEVDDFDTGRRTGWSVLVIGRAEVVHDLATTYKVLDAQLEPLVDGNRTSIVQIEPSFVSGRRIIRDSAASSETNRATAATP